MLEKLKFLTLILMITSLSCQSQTEYKAGDEVKLELVTDQVSLPTAFASIKSDPSMLFVVEQEGRIRIIKDGNLVSKPFLDISSDVLKKEGYDERGLLGLAFHPDYAKNGKFYLYCSVAVTDGAKGVNNRSEVREYSVSKQDAQQAEKSSLKKVLIFDQPQSNHNGGDLKFGNDGYLYISAGDGGGAGDKHGTYGNAQNLENFLGKILRIDVNQSPYGIPSDNPFVSVKNAKPEIYAYGLRNPWRISFDKKTNELFVGDVGQNKFEEIDIVTKGGNYGWRPIEGFHPFNEKDPKPNNPIAPIWEYPHADGISITGGFVYRGTKIPSLKGSYIFADFSGPIWQLSKEGSKWNAKYLSIGKAPGYWHVYSFGEDQSGEVYVLTRLLAEEKGAIYKIVP